jgi:hypothetical protein
MLWSGGPRGPATCLAGLSAGGWQWKRPHRTSGVPGRPPWCDHVVQTPGTSSGRPPNRSLVYLSAPTRKCSRGPSTLLSGKKVGSSYSPYATGALTAQKRPWCVKCHRPHPYVSRGPGPVDFRGPRVHDGALGPCTRSSVTASLPTSASSRPRIDDDISRSWVAHAVESARTVRAPSLNVTGVQCSATSVPTIAGHRPMTEPTATSTFHPRSTSSRSSWSPSNDGSRPEPVGSAQWWPW